MVLWQWASVAHGPFFGQRMVKSQTLVYYHNMDMAGHQVSAAMAQSSLVGPPQTTIATTDHSAGHHLAECRI